MANTAWIEQEEERSRLTREAMADVDAGRVIDHRAVQVWGDSLSTDHPLPVPVARRILAERYEIRYEVTSQ